MSMSRSFTLLGAFVACLLVAGSLGCNKQCDNKGDKPPVAKNSDNVDTLIAEIVTIINDVCKQESEEGTPMCYHTADIPAGVFSEDPVNVTIKYSGIEFNKKENQLHVNKELITATVSFTYQNFTITIEDSDSKVIINSTDNQFEITFTVNNPHFKEVIASCFFEWNNIQVEKFESSKTSFGPPDKTRLIMEKFEKDHLQKALNSTPMMDLMNKEMSMCNEESFLNKIMAAFIVVMVVSSLGSLMGNIFGDMFCT